MAPNQKVNHPADIEWREHDCVASMIDANGTILQKSKPGVTFKLRFKTNRAKVEPCFYVSWSMWNDSQTIYGEGGIWIDQRERGMMGRVFDYDGCFELPKEIVSRLSALGYDCSDL